MVHEPLLRPPAQVTPYVLFDRELNFVGESVPEHWPVAVLTVLQSCVRRALAEGRCGFTPFGMGPPWAIVPVLYDGRVRYGVFPEPAN